MSEPVVRKNTENRNSFDCAICLESLQNPADLEALTATPPSQGRGRRTLALTVTPPPDPLHLSSTACGHLFHTICILNWFSNDASKTCPICALPSTEGARRVYASQGEVLRPEPPPTNCENMECQRLHQVYGTLQVDHTAFLELRDQLEVREAEYESLQLSYEKATAELAELRSKKGAGSSGPKRRRT